MQCIRACDIISSAILAYISDIGLSLDDFWGQGYDGAVNMSGEVSGLQQLIPEKQTLALYTHSTGHVLNLAISRSCTVPHIRSYIASIR